MVCSPFSRKVLSVSWAEWLDIVALDGIYLAFGWLAYLNWTAAQPWIISYAIGFLIAASVGMVLIYSQHQWDGAYYVHGDNWSFYESAMNGSMTLRLPFAWLEWGIGYINYHSIHHLNPNIPMYNLQKCYQRLKRLQVPMSECHLRDLWKTFDRALWDERQQRMISFAELRQHRQAPRL
jgi:omega-6 fatty acid desaturase (delta-12 desaturase)